MEWTLTERKTIFSFQFRKSVTMLRLVLNKTVKLSILTRYRSGEAASWIQLRPIDLDR